MVGVPSWIRYGLAFWGIASLLDGMIMKAKPQAVERFKKRREEKYVQPMSWKVANVLLAKRKAQAKADLWTMR